MKKQTTENPKVRLNPEIIDQLDEIAGYMSATRQAIVSVAMETYIINFWKQRAIAEQAREDFSQAA